MPGLVINITIDEALVLPDSTLVAIDMPVCTIAEAIATTPSLTGAYQFAGIAWDALSASDNNGIFLSYPVAVDEDIGASGFTSLICQYSDMVADVISTVPYCEYPCLFDDTVFEQLNLYPGLTRARIMDSLAADSLSLEISFVLPSGIFRYSLEDEVDLQGESESYEPEETDGVIWDCWVLNTSSIMPSIYTGFNFNSYAEINGMTFAASSDGIYSLSNVHTEDFQPGVMLPYTSFGSVQHKRFRSGYLGFVGDTPAVKVQTDDGEEKILTVRRNRFEMTREQTGRRWQFTVAEFKSLNFVELFPIILNRSRQR